MELNENLAKEKVRKLLARYSVPCIISLLVGALYNIVDQIFIANASYLGSYGNAANTVVFPLTVIALAVAVMIGDGCCAYVSINLGMNKKDNVKTSIGNSIIMTILSSMIIMLIYLIFSNWIITMFGGTVNSETFAYAKEYFFYITLGMAAGSIPIVGYNIGAKLYKRVKEIFILLLRVETIVGLIAFIIVELFPKFLINIFGAANESIYYTEFAIKSFRIYLCMIIFACINKATFIFLQAMGKVKESMILSMTREIIFGVGFALLLPIFFKLNGVLYSMPISDTLTFLISIYLIHKTIKELNEKGAISYEV